MPYLELWNIIVLLEFCVVKVIYYYSGGSSIVRVVSGIRKSMSSQLGYSTPVENVISSEKSVIVSDKMLHTKQMLMTLIEK